MKHILSLLGFLLVVDHAFAYKTEVHSIMTEAAAKRSVLSNNALWQQMGFPSSSVILPIQSYVPEAKVFWQDYAMPPLYLANGSVNYSIIMAFGADIEDTDIATRNTRLTFSFSRALNHFYNPQANTKLPLPSNYASPDWALEDRLVIPEQHFSYQDAQQDFYNVFAANNEEHRKVLMATTLQTLGHVLHHLQDMGQPQHTRIDSHCDVPLCKGLDGLAFDGDDTSVYEVYTQNIIKCGETKPFNYSKRGAFKLPNSPSEPILCVDSALEDWQSDWVAQTIPLNSYPVVDFTKLVNRDVAFVTPRDFWTNESGTGLADFSSRNFVSTDTAFTIEPCILGRDTVCTDGKSLLDRLRPHDASLPLPSGQTDAVYTQSEVALSSLIQLPSQIPSSFGNAKISFIGNQFIDNYTKQPVQNNRLVSRSIFNERFTKKHLTRGGSVNVFSVNYFNMDSYANLLIPRAVGYSAGLINYFFRYQLSAQLVKFEEPKFSNDPITATVMIRNNSNFDLKTGTYGIFLEHENKSFYEGKVDPDYIYIPKNSSKEVKITFPNYQYTGKVSMVFYHTRSSTNSKFAEAGVVFNIDMPKEKGACKSSVTIWTEYKGYGESPTLYTRNSSGTSVNTEYSGTAKVCLGTKSGRVSFTRDTFSTSKPGNNSIVVRYKSEKTLYSKVGFQDGAFSDSFIFNYDQDECFWVANSDGGYWWESSFRVTFSCPE